MVTGTPPGMHSNTKDTGNEVFRKSFQISQNNYSYYGTNPQMYQQQKNIDENQPQYFLRKVMRDSGQFSEQELQNMNNFNYQNQKNSCVENKDINSNNYNEYRRIKKKKLFIDQIIGALKKWINF